MQRIIVTDMDDTLIKAYKQPTPGILTFWNNIDKDIIRVIATGQTYSKVKNAFLSFGMNLPDYIISDQGTVIYDTSENSVMEQVFLPNDDIVHIVEQFYQLGGRKEFIRINGDFTIAMECEEAHEFFTKTSQQVIYVQNIDHVIKHGKYSKVIFMHERDSVDELVNFSANKNSLFAVNTGETSYGKCGFCRFEIMGSDKYTALSTLLKKIGADSIDIICLGDEYSDFGLAKFALKENLCNDSKGEFAIIGTNTEGNIRLQKDTAKLAVSLGLQDKYSIVGDVSEDGWSDAVTKWLG